MSRSQLWAIVAACGGAAFAIVALTGGPGVAYAIVAVVLGAAYSIVAQITKDEGDARRRNRDRPRDRS